MINLKETYDSLPLPKQESAQSFSAKAIVGFEKHRIAKNHLNNPCLLIFVSKNHSNFTIQDQELYNISISHNLECIVTTESETITQNFSVIKYSGDDSDLKDFFLKSVEVLVASLGDAPSNQRIKIIVEKFIELFRSLKAPPKKTIQGLWGELFLISKSKNPHILIEGWHNRPEEKFDFSFDKLRIEVKSTSIKNRIHHFSIDQLSPTNNTQIIIASVFVQPLSGGKTIEDLLTLIVKKLSKYPESIEKLNLLTFTTLGSAINKLSNLSFDYQLAEDSLKFFDSTKVPKINAELIPLEVNNVKFTSDLTAIKDIESSCDEIIAMNQK